jgi:uncharacterized protein (TIGR00251 family)
MARRRSPVASDTAAATAPAGDPSAPIAPHPQGSALNLIVTPRSGITAFAGLEGDALRLRVAAPPVEGAANAAIVKFLAGVTGVPRSSISIVSGETGRRKRVLFKGVSVDDLAARLSEAPVRIPR